MKKTSILYFFLAAFALVSFKSNAQENYVLDTDFDSGMWLFGQNSGIILDNEKIVANGKFGTDGEDNFYNLIRLYSNGARDYSFPKSGLGMSSPGVSLIKHNNLYIYGSFSQSRCYNLYGAPCTDNDWNIEYYQPPYAITNAFSPQGFSFGDTAVIMFGAFRTDVQNPSRWQSIVRTDIRGKHDSTFVKIELEPNGPRPVGLHRVPTGGYYLMGPGFQSLNGYTSPGIVKLTETFEIDTTFKSPFVKANVHSSNVDSEGRPWIGTTHAYFDNYQDTSIFLMRLNTDGSIDTTFNQPIFEGFVNESSQENGFSTSGVGIATMLEDDDGYIFGGTFGKVNGQERYCMVKLSETGEVMSDVFLDNLIRYEYTGSHPPKFYTYIWPAGVIDLIRLPDGKILVNGRFNFEINGHYVHNLMRLKKQSVNVEDVPSQKESILVYPNPAKDKLTVSIPSHAGVANLNFIEISDINGRVGRKIKWKATNSEMDISGLKPGMYIFSFYAENEMVERKKVVVSQ